jgi:putative DNA primase/helicase
MKISNAAENIDVDAYLADLKRKRDAREGKQKPVLVSSAVARQPEPAAKKILTLRKGSDIKPERIEWLWDGFLARGKPHIIAGTPGTGKTTIVISLIASITAGADFPDGSPPMTGHVIIWSGEDDPSDTLVPRLMAAGANMARVHFVDRVDDGTVARPFDPAADMDALLEAALRLAEEAKDDGGVVLIMVDPIVSAVNADSHKNAETRRALQPLVNVAAETNAALIGVSHFTKGTQGSEPVDRISGSLAFGAVPRVVMVVAKQQQTTDGTVPQRIFCRAKSNIGPDGAGFTYDIGMSQVPGQEEDFYASVIVWTGKLEGTAREILKDAEDLQNDDHDDGGALDDAKAFLAAEFKDGSVKTKDLQAHARDAGHSWRTIRRALKEIGAMCEKGKTEGAGWEWSIPKSANP